MFYKNILFDIFLKKIKKKAFGYQIYFLIFFGFGEYKIIIEDVK